jgi:hypothetical protein
VCASPNSRVTSEVRAAAAQYLGLGYLPVPVPRQAGVALGDWVRQALGHEKGGADPKSNLLK